MLGTLPAFTLTNQRGEPFGTRELAGKVWVADFVFTSCQSACPLLSERMAEVGRRAKKLGPDFHLVSISVDPERDTPRTAGDLRGALRRASARLVVPDRPGRGNRGGRRRRLQGRHGEGARSRPIAADEASRLSWRSSTARTWCWSIASCASAAISPPRPRGSTCSWPPSVGSRTALDASGRRLLAPPPCRPCRARAAALAAALSPPVCPPVRRKPPPRPPRPRPRRLAPAAGRRRPARPAAAPSRAR